MPLKRSIEASFICIVVGVLQLNTSMAQKRWDGEAGDGYWQSEKNWCPDGLPDSAEVVVLNNDFVKTTYQVTLPGGLVQTTVGSIAISPDAGNTILLEIPSSNTAAPGLVATATGNSITVKNGGLLTNKSGAVAGNTLVLNGVLRIEHGGKYLHQTIRGNANIISRLATGPGTEKGIVEFDVPGNNSYPLSVSGRTYGRLVLSSKTAGRKTYTGSGNNALLISNDLLIDDSSRFHSTLNGDIVLRGKLQVQGGIYLNPSTMDSTGRQLIFSGDSTAMLVHANIELGVYFRNILVRDGILYLGSNLQLDRASFGLKIEKGSMIMADSFSITGAGFFQADSGATVGISGTAAVSADAPGAIIQSRQLMFHPQCRFVFYGAKEQCTGDGFPLETGTVRIEKSAGKLLLSKPVTIRDSLVLLRGQIISSAQALLTLKGKVYSKESNPHGWPAGHANSFVDGPIILEWAHRQDQTPNNERKEPMESDSLFFPTGHDTVFAPILLTTTSSSTEGAVQVSYQPGKPPGWEKTLPYPLKSIGTLEHWSVNTLSTSQRSDLPLYTLHLSLRENSTSEMTLQPQLVALEQDASSWQVLPLAVPNQFQHTLGSTPTVINNAVFTFGELYPTALSTSTTALRVRRTAEALVFEGETSLENRPHNHVLEHSRTEKFEEGQLKQTPVQLSRDGSFHQKIAHEKGDMYFRIRIQVEEKKARYSNTLFVPDQTKLDDTRVFPNPASDVLSISPKIRLNGERAWIVDVSGTRTRAALLSRSPFLQFDISRLNNGIYWLVLQEENSTLRFSFIKRRMNP